MFTAPLVCGDAAQAQSVTEKEPWLGGPAPRIVQGILFKARGVAFPTSRLQMASILLLYI